MRNWWVFRLSTPPGTAQNDHAMALLSREVPQLVDQLRTADRAGQWFFRRSAGPAEADLELRLHTVADVGTELARQLAAGAARHGWRVVSEPPATGRPVAGPGPAGDPVALSVAASDFVLDLCRLGALRAGASLDLVALHLWHIVDLVPHADRRGFLFHCWQHWTRELPPAQRVDLGIQVGRRAQAALRRIRSHELPAEVAAAWRRYRRVLQEIVAGRHPTDPTPTNYLLFEHTQLTHRRLGVSAEIEAVAAGIIRSAATTGPPELGDDPPEEVAVPAGTGQRLA